MMEIYGLVALNSGALGGQNRYEQTAHEAEGRGTGIFTWLGSRRRQRDGAAAEACPQPCQVPSDHMLLSPSR